jgi:hypothetical protein
MVVTTKNGRQGKTGLHVGVGNVQQLFPPDVPTVELELDHLRIVCTLEPEFWEDRPDIYDERLNDWLESKRSSGKLAKSPCPVALIPSGDHAFRLQPVNPKDLGSTRYPIGYCA